LKRLLNLKPLEGEGGYFAETYRAAETVGAECLPPRYAGARSFGTAIYYLLTPDTFSALHRLQSDEVYHFYLGAPVELLMLRPDGSGEVQILGSDLRRGQRPQLVVPRGVWQGSRLSAGGEFALMGTTMAPGWDPADFELGQREVLVAAYPHWRDWITALTVG
jgi:predicted cupin superfamily sugar epimerase